jgi:hypothetical protein
MITLTQINKGINDTIYAALVGTGFEGVKIIAEDTTEITRPSLKVMLPSTQTGRFNNILKERTLTVRVYFFAKDRYKYKLDNLKMQDILENAFLEDVKVTDTFYMPLISEEGVESIVTDTVLECSFDLYSLEEIYDDSNLEPIEELNFNLNLEE